MNDDDKKMLEEVEKLDAEATRGPWRTHTDWPDKIMGPHGQIAECVGGNHDDDAIFVARARTLLLALAKRLRWALEEIEHREATANSQEDDEEALSLASATSYETARRGPNYGGAPMRDLVNDPVKGASPEEYERELVAQEKSYAGASPPPEPSNASPFPPSSHNLKPERSLEELLEAAKNLPPMTAEQAAEQKISWVFGQNAIESENHLSEREIEGVVYKKAFKEVLRDLRHAVAALKTIAAQNRDPGLAEGFITPVLDGLKTKGL